MKEVNALQKAGLLIKGMAHITGGGFIENVPRVLPQQLSARIVAQSWRVPPVFQQIIAWSGIDHYEAYRVFNLGIGFVLVVAAAETAALLDLLPEAVVIGRLVERKTDAGIEIIF
jgi:phosphoribosylformylglycinamidine cyclo-ligase